VLEEISKFPERIGTAIENYRFREAQMEMMNLARVGNKYCRTMSRGKNPDKERVKTVLIFHFRCCGEPEYSLRTISSFHSVKLRRMLNIGAMTWSNASNTNLLPALHQLNEPVMLFAKWILNY